MDKTPPAVEGTIMARYNVFAVCNACGDVHPMEVVVMLQGGPTSKQSIGDRYQGKDLPSELAALKDNRVYCPKFGRHYSQKNEREIFLIPFDQQENQRVPNTAPVVLLSSKASRTEESSIHHERMGVLLDKLGERLSFERQSTRLYETFLRKIEAHPEEAANAPSAEKLRHICKEENEHFELLHNTITELGGDATVESPSADMSGVLSHGILQVVSDPRTTIVDTVQAILSAELMDNDGWQILTDLASELGQKGLKHKCQRAKDEEQKHLQTFRSWLSAMTLKEATGKSESVVHSEDKTVQTRGLRKQFRDQQKRHLKKVYLSTNRRGSSNTD